MPTSARSGTTWEADVVTVTRTPHEDPDTESALVFVVWQGLVLHLMSHEHAPETAAEAAAMIADAVAEAATITGEYPDNLLVRSAAVAASLRANESLSDVTMHSSSTLAMDDVVRGVMGRAGAAALDLAERMSMRDTWMKWGLPHQAVSGLFHAAADFYRAAPWEYMTGEQPLTAILPDGRTWTVSVLGNAEETFGLALCRSREDFLQMLRDTGQMFPFENSTDLILSLTFDSAAELPKRLVREIRERLWEVAGHSAYPSLVAVNLPGDTLTTEIMQDLTTLLQAVPRFVKSHQHELLEDVPLEQPIEWTDERTSVHLRYDGPLRLAKSTPWGEHAILTPSLASGAADQPGGALLSLAGMLKGETETLDAAAEHNSLTMNRFRRWLRGGAGRPLSEKTAERYVLHAMDFSEFLIMLQGVSLHAVSEYDLRVYLYDWYPRKLADSLTSALEMHRSLKRLFEFLGRAEGITCAWAAEVLAERAIFEERLRDFPGGFFWDPGVQHWQSDLWVDFENRVLVPVPTLDEETAWGEVMGMTELSLYRALQRQWLRWREELIQSGTTDPEVVLERLYDRQLEWARTPLKELGGATPAEAVRREQGAMGR